MEFPVCVCVIYIYMHYIVFQVKHENDSVYRVTVRCVFVCMYRSRWPGARGAECGGHLKPSKL
jgi:hypothetical protein